MMTLKKTILTVGALLLLCRATAWAEQPKKQPLPATAAVHVFTVAEQEIPSLIEVVGTMQAVEQAAIAAKVTGTITEMPVVLGTRINKGDLLAKISAEEISAQLLQAQAQLAQARRNLEREQKLLKKQATTPETVKSMRDMFAIAEAGCRAAKAMLDYTTIKAPFSGVVSKKIAHVGDLATPGTPLLLVENDARLQVITAVPEGLLPNIKVGDTLPIRIPAADLATRGTIAEIAPVADPRSRTAQVKINIDPAPHLHTGQFARISIPEKNLKTLFIPASAVIIAGQMKKVFVAAGGTAHLRLVRTGSRNENLVEILAGLNPGDQVIVDNNKLLVDGQPLSILQ